MGLRFYTIGVYGLTEADFYQSLIDRKIELIVDTRRRRGLRGPAYAWANSARLQAGLKEHGIAYWHELGLAPPLEIREIQFEADHAAHQSGKSRSAINPGFARAYMEAVLDQFDFPAFLDDLARGSHAAVAFLCVEERAEQCHRSLIAKRLEERFGMGAITEVTRNKGKRNRLSL